MPGRQSEGKQKCKDKQVKRQRQSEVEVTNVTFFVGTNVQKEKLY
jgi:hypothetical protein